MYRIYKMPSVMTTERTRRELTHCLTIICGRLSNNDQGHNDRLLSALICKEFAISQSLDEGTRV
jgi:hypothetical protein